jgi:hypothetical protein
VDASNAADAAAVDATSAADAAAVDATNGADAGGADAASVTPTPTLSGTSPGSPANANAPVVHGASVAGASVRLFADDGCTGAIAGSGTADANGQFAIAVSVADDSTTTFHAVASLAPADASACSPGAVTYVEDSTPPAAPAATGTTPASPSPALLPVIHGQAEPGATVRAYASDACAGVGLGEGVADAASLFAFALAVPADTTTVVHLTASDAAGNLSGCALGPSYVNDRTAPDPAMMLGSTPASPANHNAPTIRGVAEAGAGVTLHGDAACTGAVQGSAVAPASGAFVLQVAVADD